MLWGTCDCHGQSPTWAPGSGGTNIFLPIHTGQKSPETLQLRKTVSDGCEKLIWRFFDGGGQVVIYDANNGARTQRQAIAEKFDKKGIHVIYLGAFTRSLFVFEGVYALTSDIQNHFAIIKKSLRPISEMSRYLLPMYGTSSSGLGFRN
jgi:hypothetical protein